VEKKPVVERAEVECCESMFDVKKLTQTWKILACEKAKASLDVCQGKYGESKLDRMPKDLERAKSKF
jgi:hypothetical protein